MAYKNIKDVLLDATKYPAAVEAKLPEGAPKLSQTLAEIAGKIPAIPDFPMEIPDMPAPPELPGMPTPPTGAGLRRFVTRVEVTPVGRGAPTPVAAPRGIVPLVFE